MQPYFANVSHAGCWPDEQSKQ